LLRLKTAKNVRPIQSWRPRKNKNGSLTVVAVIFSGILLTCLIFQCLSYTQEVSAINEMTNHFRSQRIHDQQHFDQQYSITGKVEKRPHHH
jgi:hypothetical protein